jgi:kinesin family member C2/C3
LYERSNLTAWTAPCSGHIWIPNLIRTPVNSVQDVEALIHMGDTNRSTFATDMNEHSSRSHLILSLYIAGTSKLTREKTASKLHLIDLAGSERVSKSHAEGARLKEAQSINSSLSQLGDVIQRLKSQDAHVPYRNCSLTRLLSDSLGGASKTLLVVNLSPSKESAPESRSSCDFASRAKKVELGRATRQVQQDNHSSNNNTAVGGGRPVSVGPSARMNRARHSHSAADMSQLRASRSVSGTNTLPSPTMR